MRSARLLPGLLALSACATALTEHQVLAACPENGGEWGVYGCAAVVGRVSDRNGHPVAGIQVGAASADTADMVGSGTYALTDAGGRFALHVIRYLPAGSDSATMWVKATVIPTIEQRVATIFDSALVRVRIAPIGAIPDTFSVTLHLPIP